jgi:hypothetical protein
MFCLNFRNPGSGHLQRIQSLLLYAVYFIEEPISIPYLFLAQAERMMKNTMFGFCHSDDIPAGLLSITEYIGNLK